MYVPVFYASSLVSRDAVLIHFSFQSHTNKGDISIQKCLVSQKVFS